MLGFNPDFWMCASANSFVFVITNLNVGLHILNSSKQKFQIQDGIIRVVDCIYVFYISQKSTPMLATSNLIIQA